MIVVILTALTAVCGAARINQSYLSPISASTSGDLLAPPHGSTQDLSTGSYRKEVQGMVMDAVNRRTRRSRQEPSGPKGPRTGWPTFTQFRSTETHFGDKPLTTQSTVVSSKAKSQSQSSYGQKLVSSSPTTTKLGCYSSLLGPSHTSRGSAGFKFGQNSQSTLSAGSVSTTDKPSRIEDNTDSCTYKCGVWGCSAVCAAHATSALLAQFPPARYHQSAINRLMPPNNRRRNNSRRNNSRRNNSRRNNSRRNNRRRNNRRRNNRRGLV